MPSYVVTGASRGLGLEFVRQFSADSNNVVFALARNPESSSGLAALKASNVHLLKADITDRPALKAAAAEVAKITGGSLDYLINNAAFVEATRRNYLLDGYPEAEEDLLEKDLMESFQINVVGVVHTTNIFLPLLRKGQEKKIVTLGSGLGDPEMTITSGVANTVPYSVSKAALIMVNAKYAVEYKEEGLVFLLISPGVVQTALTPPTPADLENFKVLAARFKVMYPEWTGPLTPQESVNLMRKVIDDITIKDSGAFISHKGNKEWL